MIELTKKEAAVRAAWILGLFGLSISIVVLAMYGAICFLKKVGWLLW